MSAALDRSSPILRARVATTLPITLMVMGRPTTEVVETLPRVFNLCRAAQRSALRLALGFDIRPADRANLTSEIRREHVLRLCMIWPQKLGIAPSDLAVRARADLDTALFGGASMPETFAGFDALIGRDDGLGPLFAALIARFAPGIGVTAPLAVPTRDAVFATEPMENSVAGRQADHPLMQAIEDRFGRGPLWRAVARALDLQALITGRFVPTAQRLSDGCAVVDAARGIYGVRASTLDGNITAFNRITPTEHLMVAGGIMAQSLATLPVARHDDAGLLIDVLDPCTPVTLTGGAHHA